MEPVEVDEDTSSVSEVVIRIVNKDQIFQNIAGGPNVVRLLDVVRALVSGTPALIFELKRTATSLKCCSPS
jgi:hypothetical protein